MQINLNKQLYFFRKNIMRTFGFITAGVFVLAWLFFPNLFQWWAIHVWSIPANQLDEMGKLGPLGDIYGSLNTLFTSVTLIIVVYSAYLQRQANIDVRLSMEMQLNQAKEDNSAQLEHAKHALEQQLYQQENSNKNQLEIAEKNRLTQAKESKDNIFTNTFFNLLNYKELRFNGLAISEKDANYSANEIFYLFKEKFVAFLEKHPELDNINREFINIHINNMFEEIHPELSNIIQDYFGIYWSLIELVKKSHYDWNSKLYYIRTITESMRTNEQLAFFAISPFIFRYHESLDKSGFFGKFYHDSLVKFALRFHKDSHFWTNTWEKVFEEYQKNL